MTSCQKTDILNVAEDTIEFGSEVGKLTKAYDDDPKYATLVKQGFRVWAYADFSLGLDVDGAVYRDMSNLEVLYEDGKGFGIVSKVKYFWPASGKKLYFYTLSAYDKDWLDSITDDDNFKKNADSEEFSGLELPPFTVKETAHDDIMVADSIHQHKGLAPNKKVVKPTFRHTMTKVEFNFKQGAAVADGATEAATVILKGIYTDTLANTGKLKVDYRTASKAMAFDWTPTTADNDKPNFVGKPAKLLAIKKNTSGVISADQPAVPEVDDVYVSYEETGNKCTVYKYSGTDWEVVETLNYDSTKDRWISENYEAFYGEVLNATDYNLVTWYMIPQPIAEKTVRISYVADGKHIDQSFSLTGNNVTEWLEEVCVRYNVTIAPHKIEFNPNVTDWTPKPLDDIRN